MKDFFDNLVGVIIAILFALAPALILAAIAFVLNFFGLLDAAINAYDILRLVIILIGAVGIIRIFLVGK